MTAPNPGVRERIYVGSWLMQSAPTQIAARVEYGWADQERDSTGSLGRDLPIWYPGICLAPSKFTWELTFEDLPPADAELLSRVQSWGDTAFDFCPWLFHTESFRAASGVLQRRDALAAVPESERPLNAESRFASYAFLNGAAGNITLGDIDSEYRQAFADGDSSLTEIRYCPVFRVMLTDFQPVFQLAHREHCKVTLVEV
ncbi:MAG: hypothetical protein L6R30_20085 [Thermoanaerobaculia bacterium]|nr:hypothetical protein [Thermoanaerobaculia bacterium]